MDIAALVLRIDNRQVTDARTALDRLTATGGQTAKELDRVNVSGAKMGRTMQDIGQRTLGANVLLGVFRGALAGITAGLVIQRLMQVHDQFANIDSQLRNATRSTLQLTTAQRELFNIAQRSGQDYAVLAGSFAQISMSAGSSIGAQQQQLQFFETVSKAIALSGASAQSAAAALLQFRQGLAAGALRGEELNSILENTPALARAIAEGLGVSIGRLREMGAAGELTAERIVEAMSNVAQSVDQQFANVAPTFDRTMVKLGNSVEKFLGKFAPLGGIASDIEWLSRKLSDLARDPTLEERVNDAQRRLRDAERPRGPVFGLFRRGNETEAIRSEIAGLMDESRRTLREMENETLQVSADRVQRSEEAWKRLGEKYVTTEQKAKQVAEAIRKAGEAAGKSEVEIQRMIAAATPRKGGTRADPLRDLLHDANNRDRDRLDALREREDFEEFLGRVMHDDNERILLQINAETDANRTRADAWRDLLDPTRKYAEQLEEINRLTAVGVNAGGLSQGESALARFLVGNELDGALAGTNAKIKETSDAARSLGLSFQSAFEDAIIGGKGLRDVLGGIGQDLLRLTIRKSVTEPLANSIASSLNLGSLFGGGKAAGGPVLAGRNYLVNERGPELLEMGGRNYLMMGSRSGNVVPNHQLGAPMTFAPQITIHGEMSRSQEARLMVMMQNVAAGTVHQMKRQRQIG